VLLETADSISTPEHLNAVLDAPVEMRAKVKSLGFKVDETTVYNQREVHSFMRDTQDDRGAHVHYPNGLRLFRPREMPLESLNRIGQALPNLEKVTFAPSFNFIYSYPLLGATQRVGFVRDKMNALAHISNLKELVFEAFNVPLSEVHKPLNFPSLKKLKVHISEPSVSGFEIITGFNRNVFKRSADIANVFFRARMENIDPEIFAHRVFNDPSALPDIQLEELNLFGSNLSGLMMRETFGGQTTQVEYQNALSTITDMTNLRVLNLKDTNVPDEFVADVQEQMPDLQIIR
jgi:hypothetical protein